MIVLTAATCDQKFPLLLSQAHTVTATKAIHFPTVWWARPETWETEGRPSALKG